jgi:hypothetical protein
MRRAGRAFLMRHIIRFAFRPPDQCGCEFVNRTENWVLERRVRRVIFSPEGATQRAQAHYETPDNEV